MWLHDCDGVALHPSATRTSGIRPVCLVSTGATQSEKPDTTFRATLVVARSSEAKFDEKWK
jgi:hypothetical protein